MKNLLITIVAAFSIFFVSQEALSSAISVNNNTLIENIQNDSRQIHIKVYEDGAIWVYVYSEDGAFISKFIEQQY